MQDINKQTPNSEIKSEKCVHDTPDTILMESEPTPKILTIEKNEYPSYFLEFAAIFALRQESEPRPINQYYAYEDDQEEEEEEEEEISFIYINS